MKKILTLIFIYVFLAGCNINITSDDEDSLENTAPVVANFVFYVPEGTHDKVIANLNAIDQEGDTFSFSIQGNGDLFQVTFDGTLSVKSGVTLDFSDAEAYTFSVIVMDSKGASAIAQVEIRKLDSNVDPDPTDPTDPEPAVKRTSIQPLIVDIEDVQLARSNNLVFQYTPQLQNIDDLDGVVHWGKTFGPDDIQVNPINGSISWSIPNTLPNESFHVGIKACGVNACDSKDFILHLGVTTVVYVGPNETYTTISDGLDALSSGDTLVIRDGIYEGLENYVGLTPRGALQHPPSGTPNAYTTVMAENIGQAVLTRQAYVRIQASPSSSWSPTAYVAFKGLFIEHGQFSVFGYGSNSTESENRPHHIKFINNGATGHTEATGYAVASDKKELNPFGAFRGDHILFEGNYALGLGRYKITSYQAENVVFRRNVARYDVGTYDGEPKGTYSAYATMQFVMNNNIAVDGDQQEFTMSGELAGEYTTPTTSDHSRGKIERNIQLNSEYLLGNLDEQMSRGGGDSDVEVKDHVSWDVRPKSRYVMSWSSSWFDHMTMGDVIPKEEVDYFFHGYHKNTRGLTNSIIHNFQNGPLFWGYDAEAEHMAIDRVVERYGVDTVNISDTLGAWDADPSVAPSTYTNMTELSPLRLPANSSGGLRYLTKIEPQSNLSGIAKDGGDLGATVMTLKGKSGTLYGEAGYDVETGIPMWPLPLQDIIHEKFSQYTYTGPTYGAYGSNWTRTETGTGSLSGNRGFAVEGQTLTNYIWSYLGSVMPPLEVSVAELDSDTVRVQWNKTQANTSNTVTQYKIYRYDEATKDKGELLATVLPNAFTWDVAKTTIVDKHVTKIVITSVSDSIDASGNNESGFAYSVSIP